MAMMMIVTDNDMWKTDVDAGSPGSLSILLASSLSKMTASMATYPHEVIRTRLQNQSVKPFKYKGIFHAIKVIMAEESIRGFYKGLPTNLLRTVPSSAMTILTYEMLVRELNVLKDRWPISKSTHQQHTPYYHRQRHSSSSFISCHYFHLPFHSCLMYLHTRLLIITLNTVNIRILQVEFIVRKSGGKTRLNCICIFIVQMRIMFLSIEKIQEGKWESTMSKYTWGRGEQQKQKWQWMVQILLLGRKEKIQYNQQLLQVD